MSIAIRSTSAHTIVILESSGYTNIMKNDINLFGALDPSTPLVFTDGTKFYKSLAEEFIQHDRGYFILAPSGAGKTHYIKSQTKPHWIDGDRLWLAARAHPNSRWWLEGEEAIKEIDMRSDIITAEARKQGFWILGASNLCLKPDAIVVPDWEIHKSWIATRENSNYDGGATTKDLELVRKHVERILEWQKQGTPRFKTVADAVKHLINS